MNNIENRAREYLAEHSEYSEVFGQTFVVVDTLTAMVEFAKQETKNFEKENAELRLKLEALEGQTPWKDIKDKSELIKENAKLKEEHRKDLIQLQASLNIRSLIEGKLTKAKELLKDFVTLDKDCDWNLQLAYDAEQFLSEVEK